MGGIPGQSKKLHLEGWKLSPLRPPALFLALSLASSGAASAERFVEGRYAMGTLLEVTLEERDRPALEVIFGEVEALEARLSSFREDSELRRLNRTAGSGPQQLSAPMSELLQIAKTLTPKTDGVFDVTVGPLVSLWIEAAKADRLPSPEAISRRREKVGFGKVELDGNRLALPEGMAIDLGGIAKGYALDRVARRLEEEEVSSALLSFGESSTLALGRPTDASHWRLLLRGYGDRYLGTVSLRDQILSVSGSFGKSSMIGGQRIGHVVDPRSGRTVQTEKQVAVVARTGSEAEVWSTALLVLDTAEGLAKVEGRRDVEALIYQETDSGRAELRMTSGFERAVQFEPSRETASSVIFDDEGRR